MSVDDKIITVADGRCLHALQIRTRGWLGHGNRKDGFSGNRAWEVAALLRFGAIFHNVWQDDCTMQRDGKVERISRGELFDENRFKSKIGTRAAILRGDGHS